MAKKKLSAKKMSMVKAMEKSFSNVSAACALANVSRNTHYQWYEKDVVYREMIDDLRQILDDNIETKAISKCLNGEGDSHLIQFMLKTRLKHRGYIEKTQVEHLGELNVMAQTSIDFTSLSIDELRTLRDLTEKAKAKNKEPEKKND